jgi:hypothetical protein
VVVRRLKSILGKAGVDRMLSHLWTSEQPNFHAKTSLCVTSGIGILPFGSINEDQDAENYLSFQLIL